MGIHAQRLIAPDGSEMVVLSAADFDRLLEAYEDAEDAMEGMRLLREIEIEGTVPGAVLDAVYDEGITAVLAWRRYRGLSQAELARRAGISQVGSAESKAGWGTASRAYAPRSPPHSMPRNGRSISVNRNSPTIPVSARLTQPCDE